MIKWFPLRETLAAHVPMGMFWTLVSPRPAMVQRQLEVSRTRKSAPAKPLLAPLSMREPVQVWETS